MIVKNPEVTLEEEAHLAPEEAGDHRYCHWAYCMNVDGDDGKQYCIDAGVVSMGSLANFAAVSWGATDLWGMAVRSEAGKVIQPPNSVYKIADFPEVATMLFRTYPAGTLKIKKSEHRVAVDLGDFHVVCKDDKTWHFSVEDKEKGIKAELVHASVGFPMWYHDKKKLEAYTTHSIGGGYFWPGTVEGTLTIEGREVRIHGKGGRQRYYAKDYCSDEVGGWHDWTWFHFDEVFGCLDELKLSKYKEMSLYLVDKKQYFQAGSFNIEHHDWAYLRELGVFIPTRYKVTVETEAGFLEMAADVVGTYCWAVTEVPDSPFAMLDFDKLDGTFTYNDGRKRTLTNGRGGTVIRQWRPYPNIYDWFIPEIAGAK